MTNKLGLLRRIIVISILLFASFSSLGLVVFSGFQISTQKNSTIDCSSEPFSEYHPLQYIPAGETQPVSCPWPGLNSTIRIVISLIAFILPFPLVFFAFIKKRRWMVILTIFVCFLFSVLYLSILVYDSMVLNTSRLWCKDYDGGANDCKYLSFIGMTAAEGTLCVLWFFEVIIIAYYAKKYLYEDYTDWDFDYGDHGDGYATDDGIPSNPYSARKY